MLSTVEKIIFIAAILLSAYTAFRVSLRIVRVVNRGRGRVDWSVVPNRLLEVIAKTITFQPVFRFRFLPSLFHAFIGWAFILYLLVNLGDILEGLFLGFDLFGAGTLGNWFRLTADLLSVAALIGMTALVIRRFILRPSTLSTRQDILLSEKARRGISRDSAIVAGFIFIHVGARFVGQSIKIGATHADPWQPFANAVSNIWIGTQESALIVGFHITFWLALGTILLFIPYFLYSKHLHLIVAPINFLIRPTRKSIGELDRLDFDDESIEQFGASNIEDLEWKLILDAYACIMCYRCQEVCPAYDTGKVLSPAALEINKRYFLNAMGPSLAAGERSQTPLSEFAISPEAIWACTACGACVDICPVGNEPMRDILEIRRALVLMENNFPEQLQTAFRGMERTMNPWNISQNERLQWAEGLDVPTIEHNPDADLLWWVGCAPATDARAQKTARAFAEILNTAGVNYAVLGEQEQCTGDSARRAGNEFLFNEMAMANVELLNEVAPKRIVTTCPHCLHTISNEYPAFGGNYHVIHHSQLINELIEEGRLNLEPAENQTLVFHDPCYLGRQNDIFNEPRQVLARTQSNILELSRSGRKSFCCGAGGAQMWKEEAEGMGRVSAERFREAQKTNADLLAVGCPFCMVMLNDAKNESDSDMEILDIAEIVVQATRKS
ncbi:MAG: heterodisulfide reductase-related iron-sulfur binding cluster [Anaerolineales bacterium]|nr:heterodisulfide reductase-related iron-sulfur binding cluster [Anaerolineales bacterium]